MSTILDIFFHFFKTITVDYLYKKFLEVLVPFYQKGSDVFHMNRGQSRKDHFYICSNLYNFLG